MKYIKSSKTDVEFPVYAALRGEKLTDIQIESLKFGTPILCITCNQYHASELKDCPFCSEKYQ